MVNGFLRYFDLVLTIIIKGACFVSAIANLLTRPPLILAVYSIFLHEIAMIKAIIRKKAELFCIWLRGFLSWSEQSGLILAVVNCNSYRLQLSMFHLTDF
jgi:hypothetical protein